MAAIFTIFLIFTIFPNDTKISHLFPAELKRQYQYYISLVLSPSATIVAVTAVYMNQGLDHSKPSETGRLSYTPPALILCSLLLFLLQPQFDPQQVQPVPLDSGMFFHERFLSSDDGGCGYCSDEV